VVLPRPVGRSLWSLGHGPLILTNMNNQQYHRWVVLLRPSAKTKPSSQRRWLGIGLRPNTTTSNNQSAGPPWVILLRPSAIGLRPEGQMDGPCGPGWILGRAVYGAAVPLHTHSTARVQCVGTACSRPRTCTCCACAVDVLCTYAAHVMQYSTVRYTCRRHASVQRCCTQRHIGSQSLCAGKDGETSRRERAASRRRGYGESARRSLERASLRAGACAPAHAEMPASEAGRASLDVRKRHQIPYSRYVVNVKFNWVR